MSTKADIKHFKFVDLPIISMNKFYAGMHWTKRKKIKDMYHFIIKSVTNVRIDFPCDVEYTFWFSKQPLDCTNTSAMIKMIEDCLFVDDSYKMVRSIKTTVEKRKDNIVFIKVIPA